MSIFAFSSSQNNGFLAFADLGDITDPRLDDEEFESDFEPDDYDVTFVAPGVFVLAYGNDDDGEEGILKTFSVDPDGTLTLIDELAFEPMDDDFEFDHMHAMDIIKVDDEVFAIAYKGDGNRGWIATVEITDEGEIGDLVLDTLEFEGKNDICDNPVNITLVSRGVAAVVYGQDDCSGGDSTEADDGILKTFEIDSGGSITFVDELLFETTGDNGEDDHMHDMDIVKATDGIFAIANVADVDFGYVTTVDIDDDGNIGSVITKFEFSNDEDDDIAENPMSIIQVSDGLVAVVYRECPEGCEGILKTFEVDSAGGVTLIDTLDFETDSISAQFEIIHLSGGLVSIAYESGLGTPGVIVTILIEEDGTIDKTDSGDGEGILGLIEFEPFVLGHDNPVFDCAADGIVGIAYDSSSDGTVVTVGIEGSVCVLTDFKKSGGGSDSREYLSKPTFGLDHKTQVVQVEGGFTANGKVFDVTDNWHTDFEKQAILVGQTNTFSAKVYAQHVINIVEFMFGIPEVGQAHLAEASIEVTVDSDLNVTNVQVNQNGNLINPTSVTASAVEAQCKSGDADKRCVYITVSGIFNEGLLNDVFALKGIDFLRHFHLTYLNEGFTIFGNSLNPATTLFIASNVKGGSGLMEVTQIDKEYDMWVDKSGIEYERNSFGTFLRTTPVELVRDDPMVKVMTRMNSNFEAMKQNELDKATAIFDSSLIQKELPDSFRILDSERTSKLQDPEIQLKLFIERMRADEKMNQLNQMWYAKPNPNQLN